MASDPDESISEAEPTPRNALTRPSPPQRNSSLNVVLPQFVRSRLSTRGSIPSLRERISPFQTIRHSLSMSNLSSFPGISRPGPDAGVVSQRLQELGNLQGDEAVIESSRPSSRDESEDLFLGPTGAATPVPAETASGIRWNFASTGETTLRPRTCSCH
jgi:hypothetical protein